MSARHKPLSSRIPLVIAMIAALALVVAVAPGAAWAAPEQGAAAAGSDDHSGDHSAHGDDAHGAIGTVKQGLATGVTAIIVFFIVVAILGTQVWPKIDKGLEARNEKILEEITAAETARKQAREALDEYEKNLAEARAEAQRILDQTKQQQQKFAQELKDKANEELAQMRDRARRDIEAAKRVALAELYSETAALATSVAGKILQREVSDADQQRLVEQSLAELGAVGSAVGSSNGRA